MFIFFITSQTVDRMRLVQIKLLGANIFSYILFTFAYVSIKIVKQINNCLFSIFFFIKI